VSPIIFALAHSCRCRYRWAFFQLIHLRRCLPGRIQCALYELPETLNETYERMLRDIDDQNWEYAHRLFQCVAAASRPLRVEELSEFLAFNFSPESTPTLQADLRSGDPVHAVLSACSRAGLLGVVDVEGSPVVQFSHLSVIEYLTSERLVEAKDTVSRFHVSITQAHTIVGRACLGALLDIDENVTKEDLKKFPLAEYAAENWVGHARIEGVSSNIQDGMKRLFHPSNCHFAVWTWIYDPEWPWRRDNRSKHPPWARATPLHYVAFCGLPDIVNFLIAENLQDINARGFGYDDTPLLVASRADHSEITRILLQHGANTEIRNGYDLNPLAWASACGYVGVVQTLLEHRADVKAVDEGIVQHCTWRRRMYSRKLLGCSSSTAQMQTQGAGDNQTPLHRAKNEGVARVLFEYGADTDAQDSDNRTPLHCIKNKGVARVLLEYGADTNAQDSDNRTPLHWAKNEKVAQVLLEYGADKNARDSDNQTPLHQAANEGVTRVLLELGADANSQDSYSLSPLHWAKNKEIARLLLEYGADTDAQDSYNRTPLHCAKDKGVAPVLLEYGANANARDSDNRTPLHCAGNELLARVLLESGADANARDNKNRTPLHCATNESVALALLEHGADANAQDSDNRTPLHRTLKGRRVEVARVLLETGADAHARDSKKNKTPLHLASRRGYLDLVLLLLQRSSDIYAQDDKGQTPFQVASKNQSHDSDIIKLLLKHGADDHRAQQ